MNIILYLLQIIQYQYKIISQLLDFICRYIPLKQWAFYDSHSPSEDNRFSKTHKFRCPHCSHILEPVKNRTHFVIHKCKNPKCSYYLHNLRKVKKEHPQEDKYKYKLHYIYREFQIDFFKMDLNSLPKTLQIYRRWIQCIPSCCTTILCSIQR